MKYLLLLLLLMPLMASCAVPAVTGHGNIVPVDITDQGIAVRVENIKVGNMSPDRIASALYRIHNNTSGVITPDIFPELTVDTSKYAKAADYSTAPVELSRWLVIPECGSIPPGEFRDYTVSLAIPKDAKIEADKWAYRVGVAGGCGGFTQTAISVWWLIDMR